MAGSRGGVGVPARARPSLLKLRLSMIGVWAAVTGLATLILTAVLLYLGMPIYGIYGIFGFVVAFHFFQWLIGPYIINAIYNVREIRPREYPWLHRVVERLSRRSGLERPPKLMLAEIDIPNAFAYGSPLTGNMVAVTRGLLNTLDEGEVEAVLGHEIGHLKHKDVIVMMMVSLIPAIIYYIGYSLYMSGWFGGYGYGEEREGEGAGLVLLIGILLIAVSYIFNLFVFYMSRLREYYADSHSAMVAENGARNLQRGLVKIMMATGRLRRYLRGRSYGQLKMFFIADPDVGLRRFRGNIDELIEEVKREKPSVLAELFSTHPHPAKRLRFLDQFIA
ncbi:MAG: zinc metalloprotease HtpX [Candidatus Wolframiiraptor sp. EX4484-121]|nr:MAG: zinc metalloprotease HtpX [Candidatus Wolframiiraptor sp. EX4484-121]